MSSLHVRAALMAGVLAAAGCAMGPDRAAYLNTLVGQPQTELVRQMGVPTRTFAADGRTFLAYESERSTAVYGGGPFFGGGFGGYYGGGFGYGAFPTEVVQRRCETTFEIVQDRVASWALRGNACG